MLIKLFILNKDLQSVAVWENSDYYYEYIQGHDQYMESTDKAVSRIAREAIGAYLDEKRIVLVRRESSTIVRKGACKVNSVATFLYECRDSEVDLSKTKYEWVKVSEVISELCDCEKYFEVAYLSEACDMV